MKKISVNLFIARDRFRWPVFHSQKQSEEESRGRERGKDTETY